MQYVTLNDGNKMPQLGFGVFQVPDLAVCEQAVSDALETGYRLIDTAAAYANEARSVRRSRRARSRAKTFFVTSKLWVDHFTYEKAKQGIDDSLRKLGLDYLDLYLLHQPYGDVAGAWRALEEAQQAGKIRSIGVSNFAPDQLINLELMSNVKPAVNQIEVSPWYQEKDEVRFAQEQDVQVEAWAPVRGGQASHLHRPDHRGDRREVRQDERPGDSALAAAARASSPFRSRCTRSAWPRTSTSSTSSSATRTWPRWPASTSTRASSSITAIRRPS